MKSVKTFFALLTVVLLLITAFAGCKDSSIEQSSVALVIGAHKYNPKFTVSTQLNDTIYNAARSFGNVSVTISSGAPTTVANWNLDVEKKDVGDTKLNQIAKANTKVIINEIADLSASNPEVDTLSAITQAVNNLSESKSPVKQLIIYDSGLSTKGYLDFNKPNLILSDSSYIVNQLQELHAIPDMHGISITWYGIGQVRGQQSKLDSDNLYKLKSIWEALLIAGNPESIEFIDSELSANYDDSNLPDVSIVELPSNTLETDIEDDEPPKQIFIQLTNEKLSFCPDSAEFSDKNTASEIIDKVANMLNQSNASGIYIIGSTATIGSYEGSLELSKTRADIVKNELEKKGVNINITTVGIGQKECSLRTKDTDSKGKLIESQAKQNRAVYIISEDSDTTKNLIEEGIL